MPVSSSFAGRLAAAVLAVAGGLVALRLYPHELPQAQHPDLLAVVFYSRAMVFAGRVTLLCLAVFAVLSIGARIARREWLLRAGPFEVERAVGISERERDELKAEIVAQRAKTTQVEARLHALAEHMAIPMPPPDEETDHATH
jgi:hypothetical protein